MSALEELATQVRARLTLPAPDMRRALRIAAGATLSDVARVVGVTKAAVWHWETGEHDPSGANLAAYSAVLELFQREVGDP